MTDRKMVGLGPQLFPDSEDSARPLWVSACASSGVNAGLDAVNVSPPGQPTHGKYIS